MKLYNALGETWGLWIDLVREMKDIPKKNIKSRELSYKASKDVLKSVGLLPTPVQSQVFVNLYLTCTHMRNKN